ncbi:FAST kinase domain-containing protein 4 isoform X2 [Centropristis striata]|uniref:FAST kinase domain-containing protein 4 isoform X2 n=1 Tax=Centropristis striata TaxID=184440 RepID=UPI0027DF2770|nr:FAST kinase domain-containing protein 4 isoform X2 [Centropristis striata]
MASRLLGRYAHLLCRASSHNQAIAATAARLPPLVRGPAEVQKAHGWPRVTERFMSEGRAIANDVKADVNPRITLHDFMEKATEPDDILAAWVEHGKDGNDAARALYSWTQSVMRTKGKFEEQDLMKDSRLKDLFDALSNQVTSVFNANLVSVQQSLWFMDLPPSNFVLQNVQTEVLWRIRKLTYKQLSTLAIWGGGRKGRQNVTIVNAALKQLEMRWTEISDTKTVSALMYNGQHMSQNLISKLEDKALELAESFSAEEIRKVCTALAAQSRRTVPLLRALTYHLLQKPPSNFTTQLIVDMAYACGKLKFNQTELIQRMSSELIPRVPELIPRQVIGCAKSLGFLRWLHVPLFEAFAEHFTKNNYSTPELCNLLMTYARLNFKPSNAEEFYNKVHSMLGNSLSGLEPFLQTDVVWSLCVLQQAKPQYLVPLMTQSHIKQLSNGSPAREHSFNLKLLHIAATLHLEHPGSSDAPLPPGGLSLTTNSNMLSPLQSSLRGALMSLVGGRTEALRTGVDTVYGWTIEGELVLDYLCQ